MIATAAIPRLMSRKVIYKSTVVDDAILKISIFFDSVIVDDSV